MPALNLHGVFARDPNENPMMLPFGGAVLSDEGQIDNDDATINPEAFVNSEGWDPPSGNGLLNNPYKPNTQVLSSSSPIAKVKPVYASKLDHLLDLETQIRELLIERRELLLDLKHEKEEIEKRLQTADKVSEVLDGMFPVLRTTEEEKDDEGEFKPEEEDEL